MWEMFISTIGTTFLCLSTAVFIVRLKIIEFLFIVFLIMPDRRKTYFNKNNKHNNHEDNN